MEVLIYFITGEYLCPCKFLFHIPCPVCGMTRAYVALFHLDIGKAFYWHPLFWLMPFVGGVILYWVFSKNKSHKKIALAIIGVVAVAFFIVWILRIFSVLPNVATLDVL